jgi:hypothetical protein
VTKIRLLVGLLLSTAIWGQFPQEMGNWRPPSGETPLGAKEPVRRPSQPDRLRVHHRHGGGAANAGRHEVLPGDRASPA